MGVQTAMRRVLQRTARTALLALAFVLATGAALAEHELSGKLSLETRWFPRAGDFDGQRNYNAGGVV